MAKSRNKQRKKRSAKPVSKATRPEPKAARPASEAAQPTPKTKPLAAETAPHPESPVTRAHWLQMVGVMFLLAVMGFGFISRVAPSYAKVFSGDEVRLLGADAYYHMRHIRSAANNWPSLLRWDPATHYPFGQRSQNAGAFDWITGALVAATAKGDVASDREVARVAAWMPPLLAMFAMLLLFLLGRTLVGGAVGIAMAGLFALYPGATTSKMLLGFADHHALEVALATLVVWLIARGLCVASSPRRAGAALGGALALYFFSWGGAPILIAITALCLATVWMTDVLAGRSSDRVAQLGTLAFGGFALTTLAIGLLCPNAIIIEKLFWPAIAGSALTAALSWKSPKLAGWLGAGPARRRWLAVLVLVAPLATLATIALANKGVGQALAIAFSSKERTVSEHLAATPTALVKQYGALLVLVLAFAIAAVPRALRSSERRGELAVTAFATCAVALHLASRDYGYLLAPLIAAVAALAGASAWAWLQARTKMALQRGLAFVGLAGVISAPVLGWTESPLANRAMVDSLRFYDDSWRSATTWLRDSTDQPTVDLDRPSSGWGEHKGGFKYPEGTYGVIVPWSWGNFVAAIGRRPVWWSQGSSRVVARWLTNGNERLAYSHTRPNSSEHFRYVVVDARTVGPQIGALFEQAGTSMRPKPSKGRIVLENERIRLHRYDQRFDDALVTRMFISDGVDLGHFRLAYETPEQHLVGYRLYRQGAQRKVGRFAWPVTAENEAELARLDGKRLPSATEQGFVYDAHLGASIKIFEIVPGARIRGKAPANAKVVATLDLEVAPTGRELHYRREVTAGDRGEFEITVAHPTESSSRDGASAKGRYRVQVTGTTQVMEVGVSEQDVAAGRVVAVDSLMKNDSGSL